MLQCESCGISINQFDRWSLLWGNYAKVKYYAHTERAREIETATASLSRRQYVFHSSGINWFISDSIILCFNDRKTNETQKQNTKIKIKTYAFLHQHTETHSECTATKTGTELETTSRQTNKQIHTYVRRMPISSDCCTHSMLTKTEEKPNKVNK